ncbi:uncharacterized protein BDV17DRAFT_283182 [Aspergillus undulatus]|uniref:uncharacterized protein n=1 Tax=Aspergillus undulatus TaxID=1810928 RepID=UPI003CCD04C2
MDVTAIYAITAGGIFTILFLTRTLLYLANCSNVLHISYAAATIVLIFLKMRSRTGAGRQAEELALVKLSFLLSVIHLTYLADLVGITWRTCRRIHCTVGWMTVALISFHIVIEVQGKQFSLPPHLMENLFFLVGACSLGVLFRLSVLLVRQYSYKIPFRRYQILTALFVYGIWRHLSNRSRSSRIYPLFALGMFGLTLFLQTMALFYRNGLFTSRGFPIAEERPVIAAAHIRYINLWILSVMASWSSNRQDIIVLLLQPCHGLSADLVRYAPTARKNSISFVALGHGIAAAIPYHKKIIYGYNTCTSQVRRLRTGILHISIYVRNGLEPNRFPFANHDRVCLYQGQPDYQNIVSLEASGDQIERLPNIQGKQGKTFFFAADGVRDHIRKKARGYLHQGMKLSELEYQPCAG